MQTTSNNINTLNNINNINNNGSHNDTRLKKWKAYIIELLRKPIILTNRKLVIKI